MNRTYDRQALEAYQRERIALMRLGAIPTKRKPVWSRGFKVFWFFGLAVIVGGIVATAVHA